ncbi:hypothetical protein CIK05_00320 [Bdellovibrio sp. qaytius]|nr:hypothetical protein CIK05_00320 [Bdellovibrio sp. qaytius]
MKKKLLTTKLCLSVAATLTLSLGFSELALANNAQTMIYGVTLDSVTNTNAIVTSLKSHAVRPTARIVFDEYVAASYYKAPVTKIKTAANIMGELLDSYYVKQYTPAQYQARTTEYLNSMQDVVDIWEVGNEINGEWLGTTASVVTKMSGAYDQVKARGKKAALTLYYNEECWAKPQNEMFTWANNNVPARMKQGLDYVLISYYEDDCNDLQPNWPVVFAKLAKMFPNSKIGFGETGTTYANRKASYINRYYNMNITEPNYIGGYFWWYYRQDMVPMSNPLWATLNQAFVTAPK